jgi:hypothetical protein
MITSSVSFGLCVVCPSLIYRIKEGQTTQRPKDTEGVIRICKSKKDRQHKGQKILKG